MCANNNGLKLLLTLFKEVTTFLLVCGRKQYSCEILRAIYANPNKSITGKIREDGQIYVMCVNRV